MTVFLIVFLAISIVAAPYLIFTRATEDAGTRARAVLEDGAREQSATLTAILSGQFQLLETVSASFSHDRQFDLAAVSPKLESIRENTDFSHIFFILPDGTALIGDCPDVSKRAYFAKVMAGEPAMMYSTALFSERPGVVLCVPYYADGAVRGALAGILYESEMRQMLVSRSYNGESFSFLADSAGNIIVNAEKESRIVTEPTVAFLAGAAFSEGETYRSFLAKMRKGESGSFAYMLHQEQYVTAFVPLGGAGIPENDWYVINVAAQSALESEIGQDLRSTTEMMLLMALLLGAVLWLFIIRTHARRKQLEKEAEAIRLREEQFRIVTKQTGRNAYRYDIPKKTFYRDDSLQEEDGAPALFDGTAESAIDNDRIAAESLTDYRTFFERIEKGESPVSVDVLLAGEPGRRYCRLTSTTQFNKDGAPLAAIISAFDCTQLRAHEIAYAKWQQELRALPDENTALFERNLSRDVPENASGTMSTHFRGISMGPLNEQARAYAERRVQEEDRNAFCAFLNRERLIGAYRSGGFSDALEYRERGEDGQDRWIRLTVQLVQYPGSDEIKSYVIARDIDEEKRASLALIERAERDSLTGVLNRESFTRRVKQLLCDDPYNMHVLMMIDLDGFKLVNDIFGHDAGDETLITLTGKMRSALRTSDLLGRVGGDEFMLCLPDMPYETAAERRAEQLCQLLRMRLGDQVQVSASIGMVVCPRDGNDFETLYKNADAALYHTKEYGKNGYCFYAPEMSGLEGKAQDGAALTERVSNAKTHVLVVSESPAERMALASFFSDDVYSVTSVRSAHAALQYMSRLRQVLPICVVDMDSDLGMQLLEARHGSRELMGIPVLAISASGNNDRVMQIIRAGADGVLVRPVDDELLRQRVLLLRVHAENEREQLQKSFQRLHSIEDERYRQIVQASGTVVFVYDVETRTYSVDPLAKKYIAGDFDSGRPLEDVLKEGVAADETDIRTLWQMIHAVTEEGQARVERTLRARTPSGELHWFRLQMVRLDSADEMTKKLLFTVNDINERMEAEEKLRFRAERDPLTGLFNADAFAEYSAAKIRQRPDGYYMLATLDLDNFKSFNDSHGRNAGDALLAALAEKLRALAMAGEGLAARISADNFAVLYHESDATSAFHVTGDDALGGAYAAYLASSHRIGRYAVTDKLIPVRDMLDRANIAKASVKKRYDAHEATFSEAMREKILQDQALIVDADDALAAGQFEVFYQPLYNIATGTMIGAEALVRWRHPLRGMIPPGLFVPLFEANGFIYALDRYIWGKAASDFAAWRRELPDTPPVSVNVSRYDLFHPDFIDAVMRIAEESGLPKQMLQLEVTESTLSASGKPLIQTIRALQDAGFIIEIDDFGSGYSSLNTLKDVPADMLKLDMRFLADLESTPRGGTIIRSVVGMAHALGMPVIAEGVETQAQAEFLRSIGCVYVQGYLYAKPMPASEFALLLKAASAEGRLSSIRIDEAKNADSL